MATKTRIEKVSIKPGISILSVLRYLNYRPWFAIAEFLDNSLWSYLQHKEDLEWVEGENFKLRIEVELYQSDNTRIVIRDNAAGIYEKDYTRAFRPAEMPPDRNGLAEFGMGMKSAACWFAPEWSVRTSALGEQVERTVFFNINSIVRDDLEELDVQTKPAKSNDHYTEIVLQNLHRPPQGRTIGKIKEHLASIYRVFLRQGILDLRFNNEQLKPPEWKILKKPYHKTPYALPVEWKKEIDFDFGRGLRVHGFAAIFETGNIPNAGFALFRRNRLIQGSVDEGYRPEKIFGSPNKFRYQRVFGELHLEGFEVSHTKDGFRWEDNEEEFLDLLREHLDTPPLRLLDQAEEHRVKEKLADIKKSADIATKHTADVIEREVPPILERQIKQPPETKKPPDSLPNAIEMASKRVINVLLHGSNWQITLELTNDPAIGDWITVSDDLSEEKISKKRDVRRIVVRLSLAHPFTEKFGGTSFSEIEPLVRIAAAIGLAEIAARDGGVNGAVTIRRNINELLRDALAKD